MTIPKPDPVPQWAMEEAGEVCGRFPLSHIFQTEIARALAAAHEQGAVWMREKAAAVATAHADKWRDRQVEANESDDVLLTPPAMGGRTIAAKIEALSTTEEEK